MKRVFTLTFALLVTLCVLPSSAHAQFNVDWGTSNDNGNPGYTDLGAWFFTNGYSADQASGETKAKTGYVGYGAGDSDPFFFGAAPSVQFEAVGRNAGNAAQTSFGYYTGQGGSKSHTQVLAPLQNGPLTTPISESFGLFIDTPTGWQSATLNKWYSDRAENAGNIQALIYPLAEREWLVAWEDLSYASFGPGGSDRDFNDLYVKVTVTPEPASMALFGLGAGLLALSRRRFLR